MIALARPAIDPQRIVRRLTGAPDGVASSDWLARHLGCDPDDLVEPLAELADAGRVLVWPAAIGVLGVMLARTARARSRRRPREGRPITGLDLDRFPAPQRRTLALENRDRCTGMPYPGLILIGESLNWYGPSWERRRPCAGCGGRRLTVDTYCLVCDRAGRAVRTWGVRAEAEPIRRAVGGDGLAGGTGPVDLDDLDRELRRREAAQAERNRSAYGIDPAALARAIEAGT
jgi:hypothetical protein